MSAHEALDALRKADAIAQPKHKHTMAERETRASQVAEAKALVGYARAMPTHTIRDYQRTPFGIAPNCARPVMPPTEGSDAIDAVLRQWRTTIGSRDVGNDPRSIFKFLPGDIIAFASDGLPFSLIQCRAPFERNKTGRGCQVKGVPLHPLNVHHTQFKLKCDDAALNFLLGDIIEIDIPTECMDVTSWSRKEIVFQIDDEWHAKIIDYINAVEQFMESDSDSENDDGDGSQSAIRHPITPISCVQPSLNREQRIRRPVDRFSFEPRESQ